MTGLRALALMLAFGLGMRAAALRACAARVIGWRTSSLLAVSRRSIYEALPRSELQTMAKTKGVKANLASAEIIRQLEEKDGAGGSSTPPTASTAATTTPSAPAFQRGQAIQAKIIKFGPLGASVTVEGGDGDEVVTYGLVLQREIALFRERRGSDVLAGEVVPAFVEQVRDDGRLNVSLRPVDAPRILDTAEQVLEALEGSPSGVIPIGDRSPPEDISAYFYGVTKSDFKKAVGSLYKRGIAKPGPFSTELIPEEDRAPEGPSPSQSSKAAGREPPSPSFAAPPAAAAATAEKTTTTTTSTSQRLNSQRGDIRRTVFLGNLPTSISAEAVLKAVTAGALRPEQIVPPIRIPLDDDNRPRGFAYIEMTRMEDVEGAVRDLKGMNIGGRVVRSDYADPERKRELQERERRERDAAPRGTVRDLLQQQPPAATFAPPRPPSGSSSSSSSSSPAPLWQKKDPSAPPVAPGRPAAATLYLGNLAYKAGAEEITRFLESKAGKGSVRAVRLASDETTGRKKGYAFVDFYQEAAAKQCFDELHDVDLLGRNVQIDDATRR